MTTQTWEQQLNGFLDGLAELKRLRDEARAAGKDEEAKKYDAALKGSAEAIRKWLMKERL
jgi:hypothetical protein